MREEIRFLRESAEKLRQLASLSPDIGDQLRSIADDLEAEARRLENLRRPGS